MSRELRLLVGPERHAATERLAALELAHEHLAGDDREPGRERRRVLGCRGRGPIDLDDDDRAPDSGHRVRGTNLDRFAGLHALLGDGDRGPPDADVDCGYVWYFGDRQRRPLTHGDDGPAAEQDAGDGIVAGGDAVLREDVILELQRHRLRQRCPRHRRGSVHRGDHASLRGLSECASRGGDDKSDQGKTDPLDSYH